MRLPFDRLKVALVACGLTGLLWLPAPRGLLTGRRLFIVPQDVVDDGLLRPQDVVEDWAPQVESTELLSTQDLMKLFKTAAASPQEVLQRMSLSGEPDLQQWTQALQDWKWGLNRQQIAGIFHGVDSNGDGKVSLAELLSSFRNGYQGTQVPGTEVHEQRIYDCNHGLEAWRISWPDKKLKYCSLISAAELRRHLRPMTVEQVVSSLDADGDGAIDLAEWTRASHGLGPFLIPITEPEAEFAFKSMDVGQDGVLTVGDLGALNLGSVEVPPPAVGATADAKTLKERLLAKWSTVGNAFSKMDVDGNHQLSRAELRAGLAELAPPLDAAAPYLFEGLDGLRDGRITPPEFHGTLELGELFQTQEALRHAVHWSKEGMERHKASWIHDAKPNWQHDQVPLGPPVNTEPSMLAKVLKDSFFSPASALHTMDKDRNGHASLSEFKKGVKLKLGAAEAFSTMDSNRDQEVSQKELGAVWDAIGAGGSLDKHMEHLKSEAEDEFRQQAAKWAGSMSGACGKMGTQITLPVFQSTIRHFEPLLSDHASAAVFKQMDQDGNGIITPSECSLQLAQFRHTLRAASSVRNAFVDADGDHDHRLTREEFGKFGYSLDPQSSRGKYSVFFDDELDQDQDGYVALPTLETLLGSDQGAHLLSAKDLKSYEMPAKVHGKCILTADKDLSPGLRDKVGEAFAKSLGPKLDLEVRIVGVQEISQPGSGTEFDLLFTSQTASGAVVLQRLHDEASQLEQVVQESVSQVTSSKLKAWCSSTLDFYGPKAGQLPKGSKIKEAFGKKPA